MNGFARSHSIAVQLASGAGAAILTAALCMAVEQNLHIRVPTSAFLVPVILAAFFAGPLAGTLATALLVPLNSYLFLEPRGSFLVGDRTDQLRVFFLAVFGLLITYLLHRVRSMHLNVKKKADELLLLSEEKSKLIQSLHEAAAKTDQTYRELLFQKFAVDQHAMVLVTDAAGLITYVNDHFCNLSKFPRQQLLGRKLEDLYSSFTPPDLLASMHESLKAGRVWQGEICDRAADQSPFWIAATIVPFKDDHGCIVRYVKIASDITARKLAENTLLSSRLVADDARRAAEEANLAKDRFLSSLSHDLRTPLTPVLLSISALENDPAIPDALRPEIDMMRRNLEIEGRLIDDLLDLTRMTRGQVRLRNAPVDLQSILRGVIDHVGSSEIEPRQHQLTLDIHAEKTTVLADAQRLHQAFTHILVNAARYTPNGGAITVRMSNPSASRVSVEFTDTGVGLSSAALDRIFEPFEQGENPGKRTSPGLGLGLPISKSIIEMHNGTLEARSGGENKGSTFIVTLPLLAEPTVIPTPHSDTRAKLIPTGRHNILLVEDHADSQRVLAQTLRSLGYEVATAASVRAAIAIAEKQLGLFSLIISDIGLPDGTGYELFSRLKARWNVRGLALSGYGLPEDIQRSLAAGFEDHLTKPVSYNTLQEVLTRVLQNEPPRRPEALA